MNQITLAPERSVDGVGHIAGDLLHPQSVCLRRDPGNLHAAGGQLDKEQNHEAPEPLSGPNFHGEEIGGDDLFPVLGQKLLPRCFPNAFRCRLDAVALQNVGNRAACQFMTQIRQRALDPQITPIPVFRRHSDHQSFDLLRRDRTTGLAPRTTVIFARR